MIDLSTNIKKWQKKVKDKNKRQNISFFKKLSQWITRTIILLRTQVVYTCNELLKGRS